VAAAETLIMTRWRTTWILFGLAAVMFAFIMLVERRARPGRPGVEPPARLFTFKAAEVTNVAVHLTNQLLLRAARTNAAAPWALIDPIQYPAQPHAIEWMLAQLENLAPHTRITQEEIIASKRTLAEYGLDLPAATLTLQFQGQRKEINFGRRTPVGEGVYCSVLHEPGVFTAPAALLDRLPRAANEWRDTTLLQLQGVTWNRLEVRAAGRGFAFEVDPTNRVLALTRPTPARADPGRVNLLLSKLATAQATAFVSDNPRVELEPFGLQPPETELAFAVGTNDLVVVQFGKSPTNDPTSVFARRLSHTNIVLVPKDLLELLQLPHSAFRDRHLMSFNPAAIDAIEVIGAESFTVRHQTNGTWTSGDATPIVADAELMKEWLDRMSRLEGAVEADVVTDFKTLYGLNPPARQYLIRAAITNGGGAVSNRVVAELQLGARQDEKIFARRPDETAVYFLDPRDVARLPYAVWQLRDRRVWNFTTNQVASVTAQYHGQSRTLQRSASHQWNFAPGSQGVINNPLGIEELVHQLGMLRAEAWAGIGDERRGDFGFRPDADRVTIELKNGDKPGQTLTIEFSHPSVRAPNQVPYAIATVDGQTRIFEMPVTLFFLVVRDLFNPLSAAAGK
jgi:hypothetical protein